MKQLTHYLAAPSISLFYIEHRTQQISDILNYFHFMLA